MIKKIAITASLAIIGLAGSAVLWLAAYWGGVQFVAWLAGVGR